MSEEPIINHTSIETRNGYAIVACFLFIFIVSAITVGNTVNSIKQSINTMQTSCLQSEVK